MEPPNLRIHDAPPAGGRIEACGNCTHYAFAEAYDPARVRDVGQRQKQCTKYAAEVTPSQVCDSYSRSASRS
jgi:hypothetical protein